MTTQLALARVASPRNLEAYALIHPPLAEINTALAVRASPAAQ